MICAFPASHMAFVQANGYNERQRVGTHSAAEPPPKILAAVLDLEQQVLEKGRALGKMIKAPAKQEEW